MSAVDAASIYALLPATVKIGAKTQDSQTSSPLQDLIGVIAGQADLIDDNLAQLYDDLFISTCAPWVIPYIGDLIGYRAIRPIPPNDATTRMDVADTIGFRRRKGTLTVLDQLATDVAGWPSVAVEFFQRLAVSQYVRNHVRIGNTCVDVHSSQSAADFNTAFDAMQRTADVRRIASGLGRYNIPNVGIFVWRLMPFGGATQLTPGAPAATAAMSTAAKVGANRYTFDPFGGDVPLVNPPHPASARFVLTARANVPFPMRRFALYRELEALRALTAHTLDSYTAQFFGVPPVLVVFEADGTVVDHTKIGACDLQNWAAPTDPGIRVAVDPELGRLVFNGAPPDPVRVAYCYAFSGPYGGGTYQRSTDPGEASGAVVPFFAAANPASWLHGVFVIADSGSFLGNMGLSPDGALLIRAADFVRPIVLGTVIIDAVPGGRVTLRGIGIRDGIVIRNKSPSSSSSGSSSSTLSGTSTVSGSASSARALTGSTAGLDSAFTLILEHCTLRGPLLWRYDGGGTLTIGRSLFATLNIDDKVLVGVSESAIDAGSDTSVAIAAADGVSPCGEVDLSACTVIGTINARETSLIEDSLLTGLARFERTQAGCVRYSFVPIGSTTPGRFRCQPDLAIDAAMTEATKGAATLSTVAQQAIQDDVSSRVAPGFVSRVPGAAGYLQLANIGPIEISSGAESGDEMGIFRGLYNGRRESNLKYRLNEYLRIGLEAGIVLAT